MKKFNDIMKEIGQALVSKKFWVELLIMTFGMFHLGSFHRADQHFQWHGHQHWPSYDDYRHQRYLVDSCLYPRWQRIWT